MNLDFLFNKYCCFEYKMEDGTIEGGCGLVESIQGNCAVVDYGYGFEVKPDMTLTIEGEVFDVISTMSLSRR